MGKTHGWIFSLAFLLGLLLVLSACGKPQKAENTDALSLLPPNIRAADPYIRDAYVYAISHPEHLDQFPCYCGCGAMGHTSNLDCYVKEVKPDGTIIFDEHAFY